MAVFSTGAEHAGQRTLLSGLAGVSDFLLKNLRMDGVELADGITLDIVHTCGTSLTGEHRRDDCRECTSQES